MKIIFNSIDGINLTSPMETNQNYYFLEIDQNFVKSSRNFSKEMLTKAKKIGPGQDINELLSIVDKSGEDVTLISRTMGRQTINKLRKSGADVYITFKNNIDAAAKQYFKDNMIHEYMLGN